jgi:leucyl aminopeptidase
MTPKTLAEAAKTALKGLPMRVKVLGRAQMEKLGMGALLGVGQGSPSEPQLIIFEYRGAGGKKKEKPIALVGKGITFDSGGLNVKPSGSGMHEMHMDMSGGATVLHAVAALARLKVKKNVVGIIAAAENMVSGESYRPGDILKSMSGKTIEVLNTDAEGRLVLSDALTYAQKEYDPRLIIDVATLTGAASVALGTYASAILCRDARLAEKLREIGEETGDHAWPLPLLPEFAQNIASKRADIANIATVSPRYGDTMMGAAFLAQFVDEGRAWAHIDMAPRMTPGPNDALADGATGEPLRLLVESVRRM